MNHTYPQNENIYCVVDYGESQLRWWSFTIRTQNTQIEQYSFSSRRMVSKRRTRKGFFSKLLDLPSAYHKQTPEKFADISIRTFIEFGRDPNPLILS